MVFRQQRGFFHRISLRELVAVGLVLLVFIILLFFAPRSFPKVTGGATSSQGQVSLNITPIQKVTQAAISSGRGGTSGATASNPSFSTSSRSYSFSMDEQGLDQKSLTITNDGPLLLKIKISSTLLNIALSDTDVVLNPGQSATIYITLLSSPPGVYVGKLILESSVTREIPIVISVQSGDVSFGLDAELSDAHTQIQREEPFPVQISLFSTSVAHIQMTYQVLDSQNHIVVEERESKHVVDSLTFTKTFSFGLRQGTYILSVQASYRGKTLSRALPFTLSTEAVEEAPLKVESVSSAVADRSLLFFMLLLIIAWIHFKHHHQFHQKRKT